MLYEKTRINLSDLTVSQMVFLYYFTSHDLFTATGSDIADWLGNGCRLASVSGLKTFDPPIIYSLGKHDIRKPQHRIFNVWQFNHVNYDFQQLKEDLPIRLNAIKSAGYLKSYPDLAL